VLHAGEPVPGRRRGEGCAPALTVDVQPHALSPAHLGHRGKIVDQAPRPGRRHTAKARSPEPASAGSRPSPVTRSPGNVTSSTPHHAGTPRSRCEPTLPPPAPTPAIGPCARRPWPGRASSADRLPMVPPDTNTPPASSGSPARSAQVGQPSQGLIFGPHCAGALNLKCRHGAHCRAVATRARARTSVTLLRCAPSSGGYVEGRALARWLT